MRTILEVYLQKLNNPMDLILSKYDVITYNTQEDLSKGLLRYDKPPKGKAFLFKIPKEEVLEFHTIGMKFSIKIFFFNSKKQVVSLYKNVKPDIELISSKNPAKYVVEIPND
jgi:uncharacterized membrane protein (UPF0127 family)